MPKENNYLQQLYTDEENLIYYGTSSVLRYSLYYWSQVIDDDTHPYYSHILTAVDNFTGETTIIGRPRWLSGIRALTIGLADAVGFVGGVAVSFKFFKGCNQCAAGLGVICGGACSSFVTEVWP